MQKLQIHQWDLDPYPRKLWVLKSKKPLEIAQSFYNERGEELSLIENFDNLSSFVMKAVHKGTLDLGYVVCLMRKISVGTCAHESYHVSDLMCEDIGLSYHPDSNNEHLAYIIGYVSDKIWQVNTNNIK